MSNASINMNVSSSGTPNPYLRRIPLHSNTDHEVECNSDDPEALLSASRNYRTKIAIDVYNTFAHKHHQPKSENIIRSNLFQEQGGQLGLKYADYLLNLKMSNGKHYAVGTKVGYFRGWLAKLNKKKIEECSSRGTE